MALDQSPLQCLAGCVAPYLGFTLLAVCWHKKPGIDAGFEFSRFISLVFQV
jgi:hypothetical protein